MPKITPCLWFDDQAEEAVKFYRSIFKKSLVLGVSRYSEAGPGVPGSVLTVEFKLNGREFIALNGGPVFKFTEAVSLSVDCKSQAEVDYYWKKLSAGGQESQCGWLKDKYGLSWQIVPRILIQLIKSSDREKVRRVMEAMFEMGKLDIAALQAAANRKPAKKTAKARR